MSPPTRPPMRRRARVLSATALIGVVLGGAAPPSYADPAAEVNPQSVEPGGTLTFSVACDPTDGTAPETIDASSEAFEQGTVTLQRLPGDGDSAAGPSYQGTAKIAPAADFEAAVDEADPATEWGVDGTCPGTPGGEGKEWSAAFDVSLGGDQGDQYGPTDEPTHQPTRQPTHQPSHHSTHQPSHQSTHQPAPVQRGVHAGEGGAFTDSVPAMVAGGLLIAGALGAAVHRLRRRDRWTP
ncbi:PT domain-containing protein [Streptomyces sp. DSM 3412]|uniref:PT domain-containing protein n=1 Tax=Streptomyces gottesmaniae TaxID=3075518 RepID=A0ABU2YRA6_9ACTN|nr:PT domain-containing protein [Streptomyces sp. DSM 3412]MDT0566848.1 PT domain-containing protein [Streptomyces sp. DSM 3412]